MAKTERIIYMFCGNVSIFKKQRILKVVVCIIIASVFMVVANTSAAFPPDWLQAHLDGTLKIRTLYHGISFAEYEGELPGYDTMRLAKDRALDELCYHLSVSIQSKFEDSIIKNGDYETQHITSSLFISTRNVLSGIEERDKWVDIGKHRYWVLLVIDKKAADQQMEQQKFINEVVDRLEYKQDEVLEGIKQMTSVLLSNMQEYTDRMNQLEGLLATINTKIEASGIQTKEEYSFLRKEFIQLESSRKAYEKRLAESEQRQSYQIEALITQNQELKALMGQLSKKIQKDYFLALTNDDVRYTETNPNFNVRIQPDQGQGADYYSGEKVRFLVHASRGCYIKVTYISSAGGTFSKEEKINTLLFPNNHDTNNWINANETKIIGRLGELEIRPPYGKDVITVIASESQFTDVDELLRDTQGRYHSEITSNSRSAIDMRSRGIQVVRPISTAIEAVDSKLPVPVATDTCFIVSHPN